MNAVNKLITNASNILRFLKEFTTGTARNVSITHINTDGTQSTSTFSNIARMEENIRNISTVGYASGSVNSNLWKNIVPEPSDNFYLLVVGTENRLHSTITYNIRDGVQHQKTVMESGNAHSNDIEFRTSGGYLQARAPLFTTLKNFKVIARYF